MTTEIEHDGMDGLTAEERAILAEPDDESQTATQGELEDKAAAEAATSTTETEKPNADDTEKDKGGEPAGAAAAADPGAAAAAEHQPNQPAAAAQAEPGQPASAAQGAPLLVAQAPADADAKLADIKTKKDEVLSRFDDGDITAKEMQAELDALGKQEREIERAIDKANIAAELEQQRRKNQWDADCASFLDAHKADYHGEANAERFTHLNETVIALANMPRNANLTGQQLLVRAHMMVKAELGEAVVLPAAAKTKQQEIPKPALPPNLAGVPSASTNDPGEGKWASLDRIRDSGDGVAYEKALSALSEADRDAYLAS
jgi:hypothetical protein